MPERIKSYCFTASQCHTHIVNGNTPRGNGRSLLSILHGRFPALQSRQFRILWIGSTISVAGSQMQIVALNWHIYLLTHSTVALGMIGLARVIPIVIFSLVGGVVADAWDRRRVMFVAQVALAALAAALAGLTYAGRISAGLIYLLTAMGSAAIAFNNPARQSILPNLVPREHLPNATSLSSMTFQVAAIVGPVIAGLLLAHGGLGLIYSINSLSFLAVLVALLAIQLAPREPVQGEESAISLAAMREGLAFVRNTPILVWTIALDFFATFFSSASALLPAFATDVLHVGERGYGFLSAAPAIGSVAAGAAMSALPTPKHQGRIVLWSVVVYGLATVIFGASPWFWLSWLALAGTGASDTVSTILRQTIRQLVTPDHLRGRMTAANMIFFMGGPQLGELEAGVVARFIGAPWSVITGGIGCLISVVWIAVRAPALRRYKGNC